MPSLYTKDGKPVAVTEENRAIASHAYRTGQIAPEQGKEVPVITKGGGVELVASEDLAHALASGMRLATDAEYRKSQLESKFGKVGTADWAFHEWLANIHGGLDGASLGLSKVFEDKLADTFFDKKTAKDMKRTRDELAEYAPISHGAGEVGGMIVSALLPVPGTGTAAGVRGAAMAARGANVAAHAAQGVSALAHGAQAASVLGHGAEAANAAAHGVEFGLEAAGKASADLGLAPTELAGGIPAKTLRGVRPAVEEAPQGAGALRTLVEDGAGHPPTVPEIAAEELLPTLREPKPGHTLGPTHPRMNAADKRALEGLRGSKTVIEGAEPAELLTVRSPKPGHTLGPTQPRLNAADKRALEGLRGPKTLLDEALVPTEQIAEEVPTLSVPGARGGGPESGIPTSPLGGGAATMPPGVGDLGPTDIDGAVKVFESLPTLKQQQLPAGLLPWNKPLPTPYVPGVRPTAPMLGAPSPLGAVQGAGAAGNVAAGTAGALQAGANAGLPLKALLPAGLLDMGGGALEHGVTRALGGGALGKVAGGAARGAAEGAVIEATKELTEEALGDAPMNGEKVVAALGHGALFGGALGAGVPLLGMGLRGAARGVAPIASTLADRLAYRSIRPSNRVTREAVKYIKAIPELKLKGGAEGIGQTLNKYGLPDGIQNAADMLEPIVQTRDRVANELAQLRAKYAGVKMTAGEFVNEISPTWNRLKATAAQAPQGELLEGFVFNELGERLGFVKRTAEGVPYFDPNQKIDLGDILRERVGLDNSDKVKWALDIAQQTRARSFEQLSSAIEHSYMSRLEAAAQQMGDKEAYNSLRILKRDYANLSIAKKGAEATTAAYQTNNVFSLGDKLFASAGFVGLGPKGLLLAGAHKAAREYGAATGAQFFRAVAELGAVKALANKADAHIGRAVKGFLWGSTKAAHLATPRDYRPESYDRTVARIQALDGDNLATQLRMPLGDKTPQTRDAATATITKGVAFLKSKLPPPQDSGEQFVTGGAPDLTLAEKSKFLRYAQAVEAPLSVVDLMGQGGLTPEHVEALREVYPGLYDDIRSRAVEELQKNKSLLPPAKHVELAVLFETPLSPVLQPQFVRTVQTAIQPVGPKKPGGSAGGKPISLNGLSAQVRTEYDKREGS